MSNYNPKGIGSAGCGMKVIYAAGIIIVASLIAIVYVIAHLVHP